MTDKFVKLKHTGVNKTFVPETEKKPLMAVLTSSQFKVLACVASFQTVDGFCNSSLKQLAEATGMTEKTVSKALWELNDLRYDGKQILKVWEGEYKNRKKLFFQLLPNPLFSVYELDSDTEKITVSNDVDTVKNSVSDKVNTEKITVSNRIDTVKITDSIENITSIENNTIENKEDEEVRNMTQKEIISKFAECMKEKGYEFKIVWGRDMKFAKKFLSSVDDLVNNDKKKIIEIIVENYDKWTTNSSKYPLTINTLSVEWVQKKARELLNKEKETKSQMVKQSVEANKRQKIALESIMSRIKTKGAEKSGNQ